MGRGNCCVLGDYEGLYYIDNDDLCVYRPVGSIAAEEPELRLRRNIPFEDLAEWEYSDADTEWWEGDVIETLTEDLMDRFPSFTPCDKWITRERHAVLENKLFYIALEDNEWAMAVELIQKEGVYDDSIVPLQKRHHQYYLQGIKMALFAQFETLGVYNGAWTSKFIHREEEYDKTAQN